MAAFPSVVNIGRKAQELQRPFQLLTIEQVDDLSVQLYLCQGAVAWHRHVDEDELFMTFRGLVSLETEWGTVMLKPWEMAVVPKGVGHRSLAAWRSDVILLRPGQLANRKNGHRRLYGISGESRLPQARLELSAERPALAYRPQHLLDVDHFELRLLRCLGQGPRIPPRPGDTLLLVQQGTLLLRAEKELVPLMGGELVRVPKHTPYQLTSARVSMVIEVVRARDRDAENAAEVGPLADEA